MTGQPALLDIAGLVIGRGDARVVDGVDLVLGAGETLGIAGESGCGKSTLLLAMMGVVKSGLARLAGRCGFEGTDMFGAGEGALERIRGGRIAMVPQNASLALTPTIRIGRQIDEVLALHTESDAVRRKARIAELLTRVRLPRPDVLVRRYPHELSGGQLQRVAIAMALACAPRALLLDEPTTGLDVTTQLGIVELLNDLRRDGNVAMICVSHDLGVLARLCGRMAVMYAGRIVEDRPAADLLARPAHPYARALLSSVPRLTSRAIPASIPGRPPAPGEAGPGCSFAPRCVKAAERCRTHAPSLRPLGATGRAACHDPDDGALAVQTAGPESARLVDGTAPAIEIAGLSAGYGRQSLMARLLRRSPPRPTVSDIDLVLHRGEILGLVGESGSGKSTILKVLAGLWPATAGRLLLGGAIDVSKPVGHRDRGALRRLQLVFQNPDASLNPRHTVREILAQPLRLYFAAGAREIVERADRLLADVRLDSSYLGRYPGQLSGGERQRVALARAFAAEPDVILCDEVTSALDVSVQASVLRLIRDLCAGRNAACLFVSHDLAVVHALAHRVAVLHRGRIVEIGDAAVVCRAPTHDYTRALIAAALEAGRLNLARRARPGV